MPDARAHAPATSCLPARPGSLPRRHAPPWTALTLSRASPLLCSLSLSQPSAAVDAVHHHRAHRRRISPLSCPEEPPRPTPTPHRAKRRREPCSDALAVVFFLRTPEIGFAVLPHQTAPEPTDRPCVFSVSPRIFSPSSPAHDRAVAAVSMSSEARRRHTSSPPWAELEPLAAVHLNMLLVPSGGQSSHQMAP